MAPTTELAPWVGVWMLTSLLYVYPELVCLIGVSLWCMTSWSASPTAVQHFADVKPHAIAKTTSKPLSLELDEDSPEMDSDAYEYETECETISPSESYSWLDDDVDEEDDEVVEQATIAQLMDESLDMLEETKRGCHRRAESVRDGGRVMRSRSCPPRAKPKALKHVRFGRHVAVHEYEFSPTFEEKMQLFYSETEIDFMSTYYHY